MKDIKHESDSVLNIKVENIYPSKKRWYNSMDKWYVLLCTNEKNHYIELEKMVGHGKKLEYKIGDEITVKITGYYFDDDRNVEEISWELFYGWEALELSKKFGELLKRRKNNKYQKYEDGDREFYGEYFYEVFKMGEYSVKLVLDAKNVGVWEEIWEPCKKPIGVEIRKGNVELAAFYETNSIALYDVDELGISMRSGDSRYKMYSLTKENVQIALDMINDCLEI